MVKSAADYFPIDAPAVILIGFMGCGKSTVSRRLARRAHWRLLDLDNLIEAQTGDTIANLFRERGEAEFRDLEAWSLCAAVSDALACPAIVATGGGIVKHPSNRAALAAARSRGAKIIYLRSAPETLAMRIRLQPGRRPLIDTDRILDEQETLDRVTELLEQRAALYLECATDVVDTDGAAPIKSWISWHRFYARPISSRSANNLEFEKVTMANRMTHILLHPVPSADAEFGSGWAGGNLRSNGWQPAVDVCQTQDSILVQVEAAGIDPNAVRLQFEPGLLFIEGRRARPAHPGVVRCLQVEIAHGEFRREIRLPLDVQGDRIEASYDSGILYITLPRRTRPENPTLRVEIL